jgi:Raf kinase inhibitor-like YbhB/YbcL family protein
VGTRAYALVAEDVDASLTEWVAYNMPLSVTALDAGVVARPLLPNGAQQGMNGRGTVGYDPVCPGHGEPPHHYVFELSAVDDYITMQTGASAAEVRSALTGHVIAAAQLTATFQR